MKSKNKSHGYEQEFDSEAPRRKEFNHSKPSSYNEGDVVCCPKKSKLSDVGLTNGTVIWVIGDTVFVLCHEGYLHEVKSFECGPEQNLDFSTDLK